MPIPFGSTRDLFLPSYGNFAEHYQVKGSSEPNIDREVEFLLKHQNRYRISFTMVSKPAY